MADDLPDDYLTAAAEVVEAARELEAASEAFEIANKAVLDAHVKKTGAEKRLKESLERLKRADIGRGKA